MRIVDQDDWRDLEDRHRDFIVPWVEAYRERRATRKPHPVHDFLFTYYQTNRQTILRWRPMADMTLLGEESMVFLDDERYVLDEIGVRLDCNRIEDTRRSRIEWVAELIENAKSRPAKFNCFGLHEWAMVYKAERIRHESAPLRLSPAEIESVVESMPICCTHHDAFRFFTPAAVPLNATQPKREERQRNEQFGCIHFNMDLYRWSYKLSPWIGSELMDDCFRLAIKAREVDMRASPYDVSVFGYDAIEIENPAGREAYRKAQETISDEGRVLADRLSKACRFLLEPERDAV